MEFEEYCEKLLGRPLSNYEKIFLEVLKVDPKVRVIVKPGRPKTNLGILMDMARAQGHL